MKQDRPEEKEQQVQKARSTPKFLKAHRLKRESEPKYDVERSITVGFSQDGPSVAIPKRDFRTGILGSQRWEAPPGGIQVLETLQFEVLTVGVHNQNVVDGVQRQANLSRHNAIPPRW